MFQPFQDRLADHRIVLIPASLQGEDRARFVTRIAAAVRQQAGFAAKSDGVLQVGDAQPHDDYILIPHEPAAPLDPTVLEGSKTLPDIETLWWMTSSLLSALRAAAAENAPHGGIQPGSVLVDATGRPKLSDFGIAPAFETLLGPERRRQLHCEATVSEIAGRGICSATWECLEDDAFREQGWIAPFFGHEMLEGAVRLNPKADQFALGVVLFLLATGVHPYGVSLNDPTLEFYTLFDPYNVADERRDWKSAFDNAEKNLTQSADKPILAWAELSRKLLASDPGGRYANAAEAEKAASGFVQAAWAQASADLRKTLDAVRDGDVEGALSHSQRWREDAALPALWRARLAGWLRTVESQKDAIAKRRKLTKQLTEAQAAMNAVDLDRARKLATGVRDAPDADESQRRSASELLEQCDLQEQVARRDADKWMAEYVEAAAEALEQGDLKTAREILRAVVADPAAPPHLAAQARDLLTDMELREQRLGAQKGELETAQNELKSGNYDSASQRLETLLATTDLAPEIAEKARPMLAGLERRREQRASSARALDDARSAWERGDAADVEQHLSEVPTDFDDAEIQGMRADLESRLATLRSALEHRAALDAALEKENWAAAQKSVAAALAIEDLPQLMRDELSLRARVAEQRVADQKEIATAEAELKQGAFDSLRARLEKLQAQSDVPESIFRRAAALLAEAARTVHELGEQHELLEAAEAAADLGDLETLEARLAELPAERVAALLAEQRSGLAKRAATLRKGRDELAAAQAALDAGKAEDAVGAARRIAAQRDLPQALRDDAAALAETAEAALDAQRREFLAKAESHLNEAEAALAKIDPKAARAVLERFAKLRSELPAELTSRADKLTWRCDRCEQAVQVLGRAREDLKQRRFGAAMKLLEGIDTADLPAGLLEQIDPLRAEVEREQHAHRAAEEQRLLGELETARAALALGALDEAEAALAPVEQSELRTQAVQKAARSLRTELGALRPIAAVLSEVERKLADAKADPREIASELERLPSDLPEWAQSRAAAVREKSTALIEQRRQQAVAAARQHLLNAKAALEKGDADAAEKALADAGPSADEDAALREAAAKMRGALERLKGWGRQLTEARAKLDQGAWNDAASGAEALLKQEKLPAVLRQQAEECGREAGKRRAAHVKSLESQLAALAAEVDQRGRRVKRVGDRLAEISNDANAPAALREQAQALGERFEALPAPQVGKLPMIAGVAVLLVAIGGGAIYFMSRGGGGGGPVVVVDPNETVEPNRTGDPNGGVVIRPDPVEPNVVPIEPEPNRDPVDSNTVVADPNRTQADPNAGGAAGLTAAAPSDELNSLHARLEAARARLQAQLDAATDQAGAVRRGEVRIQLHGDRASVAVVAADQRWRSEVLPQVALGALDSVKLPEAWLAANYPTAVAPAPDPAAQENARRVLAAVQGALAPDAALAPTVGSLRVVFEERGAAVLVVLPDRPQGVQAPLIAGEAPEVAGARIAKELGTLAQAVGLLSSDRVRLDVRGVRLAEGAAREAEFLGVAGGKVRLRIPLRRTDDDRPGAGVLVSGELDVARGQFTADDDGRAQLAWYGVAP